MSCLPLSHRIEILSYLIILSYPIVSYLIRLDFLTLASRWHLNELMTTSSIQAGETPRLHPTSQFMSIWLVIRRSCDSATLQLIVRIGPTRHIESLKEVAGAGFTWTLRVSPHDNSCRRTHSFASDRSINARLVGLCWQ